MATDMEHVSFLRQLFKVKENILRLNDSSTNQVLKLLVNMPDRAGLSALKVFCDTMVERAETEMSFACNELKWAEKSLPSKVDFYAGVYANKASTYVAIKSVSKLNLSITL